jgi:L-aminopeptidase/D-esterase-like protein
MLMRARDHGIPFSGTPGPLNAITDVDGVEVGYTTLCEGQKNDSLYRENLGNAAANSALN